VIQEGICPQQLERTLYSLAAIPIEDFDVVIAGPAPADKDVIEVLQKFRVKRYRLIGTVLNRLSAPKSPYNGLILFSPRVLVPYGAITSLMATVASQKPEVDVAIPLSSSSFDGKTKAHIVQDVAAVFHLPNSTHSFVTLPANFQRVQSFLKLDDLPIRYAIHLLEGDAVSAVAERPFVLALSAATVRKTEERKFQSIQQLAIHLVNSKSKFGVATSTFVYNLPTPPGLTNGSISSTSEVHKTSVKSAVDASMGTTNATFRIQLTNSSTNNTSLPIPSVVTSQNGDATTSSVAGKAPPQKNGSLSSTWQKS